MTTEELVALARANLPLSKAPTVEEIEEQLRNLLGGLLLAHDYESHPEAPIAYVCRNLAALLAQVEDLRRLSRH